jgi:hypothetical protein
VAGEGLIDQQEQGSRRGRPRQLPGSRTDGHRAAETRPRRRGNMRWGAQTCAPGTLTELPPAAERAVVTLR